MVAQGEASHRAPTIAVVLALGLWIVLLAVRGGSTFDQVQHAHIAWALEHGERLNRDLVDHHLPLWWHVLRAHTAFGIDTGVGILVFARTIVVGLGILFAGTLWAIGRTDTRLASALPWGAWLTALSVQLAAETLWCSRPEPLSLVAVALAILAARKAGSEPTRGWRKSMQWGLVGALSSLAVAASPRAVLFLGLVVLALPPGHMKTWSKPTPWSGSIVGAFVGMALILGASDMSVEQTLWDLRLSKAVMHTGAGDGARNVGTIIACGAIPGIALSLPALRRDPLLVGLRIAYCSGLVGVLVVLQGKYLWQHSVGMAAMSFALMLALNEADAPPPAGALHRFLARSWPLWAVLAIGWTLHDERLDRVMRAERRMLRAGLDQVAEGRPVAIPYLHHPIAARDAVRHLLEHNPASALRICPAIDALPAGSPYPSCNFVGDLLEHEPVLIDDAWLSNTLSEEQRARMAKFLRENYRIRAMTAGLYTTRFRVRTDVLEAFEGVAVEVADAGLLLVETELDPDDPAISKARLERVRIILQGGAYERARELLDRLLEDPHLDAATRFDAHALAAEACRALGDAQCERHHLDRAAELDRRTGG